MESLCVGVEPMPKSLPHIGQRLRDLSEGAFERDIFPLMCVQLVLEQGTATQKMQDMQLRGFKRKTASTSLGNLDKTTNFLSFCLVMQCKVVLLMVQVM